jgi:hypothetical protein
MKKNIIILLIPVVSLFIFGGCVKYTRNLQTAEIESKAFLKVIHAAPGFTQVFNSPDNFNVLVGGIGSQRIAAAMTYNSAFPVNTTNVDTYAAVPSGAQDIRLVMKGTVNIDSATIAAFPKNLEAGKYYTLVITDSLTTPPAASKIFSEDNFSWPNTGVYSLRFIHAVMNDTTGKSVDVYSARKGGNVFTNVAPGTVLNFADQTHSNVPDTLIIRRSGVTAWDLARINGITFSNRRVYTVLYKGNTTITASTNARARSVVVYNNR